MNRLPNPFWAVILALMGVGVSLAVLFHPDPVNISMAILAIASNLVSGALGAFAGHASAQSDTKFTGANPVVLNQSPKIEGE